MGKQLNLTDEMIAAALERNGGNCSETARELGHSQGSIHARKLSMQARAATSMRRIPIVGELSAETTPEDWARFSAALAAWQGESA